MNYSTLNQEAVQRLMTSFGFDSLDQVDQLETITDYYNYLEKTGQKDLMNNGSQKFRQAKHISAVLKNQARDTLFVNEPVANTLRDFRLPFDERNNPLDMSVSWLQKLLPEELQSAALEALSKNAPPTRYVKPSSIQSTQSPAAYLKYIYDLAKAIENVNPDFDLIARRPDLAKLVLNEDNLHQEVTTLELANELLIAQYLDKSGKTEADLYENLNNTFHPLELPFDKSHSEVRYILAAMQDGMSLNEIARRIKQNDFALKEEDFTLIPNLVDRLNLYQSHLDVLQETPSSQTMYREWYGVKVKETIPAALQLDIQIVDGDVVDISPNNFDCTVHGAEIVDDEKFGKCLWFDGEDDYIELPEMDIDYSGGFTVAAWVYYESFKYKSRIIEFGNGKGDNSIIFYNKNNTQTLVLSVDKGNSSERIETDNILELGKWIHVAATIDESGDAKIYMNGKTVKSGQVHLPNNVSRTKNYIGKSNWSENEIFHGKIANLQVYNRALSLAEISKGLQLDLPLNKIEDGKVFDRSINNFECTVHGAKIVDDSILRGISFDGEDDYIELPEMNIDYSEGFTVAAWVYYDTYSNYSRIIDFGNGEEQDNIVFCNEHTSHLFFGVYQDCRKSNITTKSNETLVKREWIHVAATVDPFRFPKIYKNGQEVEPYERPGIIAFLLPHNVSRTKNYIGKPNWNIFGNGEFFHGKIAHLQVYNRALSAAEISEKYSSQPQVDLSVVERFREATKLSIEEFNQFYRNYRVKDDADNSYQTNEVYGTYISNGHNLTLKTVDAKLVMGYDDGTYLNHDFFYRFNRIIRLQKRTNIPYYQLDWLLNTIEDQEGLIDNDRLNVIAHYLDWNHKYQFSVDEFVGILTEVNSYRRMGEQETSLLRQIFGNAAPKLVKVLKDGNTKFADLESSLKEYLIIGLRITFAEYNAIVKAITNDDENAKFDKAALARMYRLVKVFTLFGWGITKGIELVEKLGLIEVFAHPGQQVSDVLSALDKLVWLSDWMNAEDNNLTIDNILTILTPPDDAGTLQATVEVEEFLDSLAQDIEEHRVVESSFTNYESWQITKGDEEKPIENWYQLLQDEEPKIIDDYGLLLNVEKEDIEARVTEIINNQIEAEVSEGYQLTESAEEQKQELILEISNFQRRQQESLAKIITQKLSGLSSEIIPALLLWMKTDYYKTLKQLLGWKYPEPTEDKLNQDTLKLLYNINRHGIVISQLELDTYTVSIAAEKTEWLMEWMQIEPLSLELSLKQAYYLYKFKTLLNAKVSSKHWLVYLAVVNEYELDNLEEQNKLLASLLDWSVEDIPNLTKGITDGLVKTVQQIEYVRRQIELCQDLHIQGEQLHQLNSTNGDEPEWEKAVAAVKLGLNRQNDEVRKKTAKDAINLELRDALVANFMNEVVGKSESSALKEKIKSWEDIYQYLLLDVNVSYEVPTTRLLECTGAVQLYINRMIQGVEDANWKDNQLENLKKDWDISQQYRLWEANKKLGLYPSNYIEPTLRLHKTEIFKTFEDSLGQGSLNEEMVQQAIMQYLQQLQQLSELRVEGFTYDNLSDSIKFCFTAKATWEANSYYYRLLRVDKTKLEAGSQYAFEWGDWRKAELVFSQQHIYGVAPCYGWNRLYMYWFELFETRSEDGKTTEYYLQPKYCRQNTDGSFGQPRNSVFWRQNIVDNSSLQLHLPLDNIVDGKVIDVSTNQRNCTVHGEVKVVSDYMFSTCIRFNGKEDEYIEIPKEAMPDTNKFTVSFWAYGDSSLPHNKANTIMNVVDNNNDRIISIHLPTESSCINFISSDGSLKKQNNGSYFKNKWTYWVFTKNVATGRMNIYVNGTLYSSTGGKDQQIKPGHIVVLGGAKYNSSSDSVICPYKGKVAHFQIYNRELSPSEISKIVSQGIKISDLGENIVENLKVKIYQPYFDQTKQQILMYFSAGVDKNLSFSSVTSKEETVVNIISKEPSKKNEIPEGYYEIDRSHPPQVRIQPESATNSIIDMKLAPQVLSEGGIQLNWELDCRESDYNLIRNRYDKGRKSVDRDDNSNNSQESIWVELAASGNEFEQKNIELAGQENSEGNNLLRIGNKKDFVRFNPPNENQTEFDITFKLCTDWNDRSAPDQTRDSNQGRKDTLFTFRVHYDDGTSQQSVFVKEHTEDEPHLADQRFLLFSENSSFYTTNLYSTAIQKIVELAHPYYDIHELFSFNNQSAKEDGVDDYLNKLDSTETYHNVSDPKPDIYMDFWGPYGIYAWEIFHYIPLMVAYKYTQSQNFDLAKKWLKHVYDPTLKNDPWGNYPLRSLPNRVSPSALGTINDPDAIARENPLYYRLSTISQYIQNLIEQGDYYYRQITTETLRQAKMYYVEAKNIFIEGGQSLANVQLGENWSDWTLRGVTDQDFIEPYDKEIMKVYQTIEERLYNLRHWLAIDGTPLNIPLIAPPIDPRVLQQAALAGVSLTQPQQQATRTLKYDFDDILGRARGYVQDLISWSTNLLQYWENYENIQYQNLADSFISFDSAIFMQEKTIEALEKNIEIQRKTKKQTEHERDFYEVEKIWTTTVDGALQVAYGLLMAEKYFSIPSKVLKGILKLVPRIFGMSIGGYEVSGPAEAVAHTLETKIEITEVMIEWLQGTAEIGKNFRELEFNEHQTTMAIEIINKEIEVSNIELEIEKKVLKDIQGDKNDRETLAAFNQKRFTNEMFFKWYVDNLKQLYRTLFDQTVSFCLLAERVYQEETGEKTIFIRPQWDDVYHGLLSGQKLLLNLQQMEYSYLQKTLRDDTTADKTFSLEEKDDKILASLKTRGKAVIHIQESWFEEDFPDEFGRHIQSIKVKFVGLEDRDAIAAELTQISNRSSTKERTLQRVCAYGKIKLLGVETDTATMKPKQKGRLLPFEGSGVESNWLLSVPAAVTAIEKKKETFNYQSTLDKIEDIEITIRYTAKY